MAKFPPNKKNDSAGGPPKPEEQNGPPQQQPAPQQQQQAQPPQMVPEQAMQPEAMQASQQQQGIAQPMNVARQALTQVAQMMDSDPSLADPAARELVEKLLVTTARLAQEFSAAVPEQTPGAGMVPPTLTGAPSPGQPPQVMPAPSGSLPAAQGFA